MSLLHELLGKYNEPYRIRHGWGLSPIRTEREMKALIGFCIEELKDKRHMKLNPERRDVYKATVLMYERQQVGNWSLVKVNGKNYYNLHNLIDDHTSWYWS